MENNLLKQHFVYTTYIMENDNFFYIVYKSAGH